MRWGWYISGGAHAVLILAVLFGGLLAMPDRAEVSVSEVTLFSEEEFAALVPPAVAPDIETATPDLTLPPEDTAPEAPEAESAPEISEPEPVEVPETPEESPDVAVPEPMPEAVVDETAPEVPMPPTEIDGTSLERDAVAEPAPRVAPVPKVAPAPEAETAPVIVEETAPDPEAPPETEVVEEKEAAPEQASDRIVTEAEEQREYAPASSMRPRARPERRVTTPEPEPEESSTDDAVRAALEQPEEPAPAPTGPPLTGGERDALRVSVSQCWNVGSLSTEALGTTVVVAVEMQQSGRPINESIEMISFSGGSEAAARQAFEAARRAIIRCGSRGFPLPVEKFSQWRDIEMTFNPEGMQFR
ncbi:MAG: energy transducer TonB [Paracoccaceae bacterium]|nr:energy transducer TonB [Paracoccaceae bacterium]